MVGFRIGFCRPIRAKGDLLATKTDEEDAGNDEDHDDAPP